MVGYNVQVAVDTEHHLIIAQAVTNTLRNAFCGASSGPFFKARLQFNLLKNDRPTCALTVGPSNLPTRADCH
jgi:hypothetical protein